MTEELNFGTNTDRLPPQNVEAEEAVLGGIMLDPEAIGRVIDKLTPDAFYTSAHKYIYQASVRLHEQESPVDLLTVTNWLNDNGLLDKVGGRNKLAQLVDRTVSAVNIDALAALVVDKYRRRQLIKAANYILQLGYETETELPKVFERAESRFMDVTGAAFGETEPAPLSDILTEAYDRISERATGTSGDFFPTGFYDLDAMLNGGFKPGKLITVTARPGCGKSSLLGNIARNMGQNNIPSLIFTLEMDKEEWGDRFLSQEVQIESGLLQSGRISHTQWHILANGIARLVELPIFIDDDPYTTVTSIRAKARRLMAMYGQLGMIAIDYLGLMEGIDANSPNLSHSIGKVTRSLKQLARECGVPVVMLSQLNRGVENRTNKRPTASDLRDSGRIEEDSDIIITIYRDEVYNDNSPDRGIAEVNIVKHRGGATGNSRLLFDSRFTQFKNLARSNNSKPPKKPSLRVL